MLEKFIFHPRKNHPGFAEAWGDCEVNLELNSHHLQGWLIKNQQVDNAIFIIYYGGNAEDISLNLNDLEKINASSFLLMNYRGYGGSTGSPSEQNLLEDALAIYDHVVKGYRIAPENIYVLGRSIGANIAAYVASQRTVGGLIMVTPFDSMEHLVKRIFWWIPLGWLFRRRFNTRKYLLHVRCRVLMVVAEKDEVVPKECTQALMDAYAERMRVVTIHDADHQDIAEYDAFYLGINQFLEND
jgi:pimeloyl-ACP methyl ester carboxylesterase